MHLLDTQQDSVSWVSTSNGLTDSKEPVLRVHELNEKWQDVAQRRKREINDRIPKSYILSPELLTDVHLHSLPETCGLLNDRELSITSTTAVDLLKSIRSGEYSSVEVAVAFCKRSAIAHQATNCLAYIMFDEAIAEAAALDEYLRIHGKPKGPLHGLPISVKEHIYYVGTPATSGLTAWADDIAVEDALIIQTLRDAGAVFHVKTTNPQGLMALETTSNLYGTTTNPHNTKLTPGGSSGGESALVAMRGSLLGIGTDIGGSIRAPCAFTGIYGLKPSVNRLPHGGLSGIHGGMENIIGCVGPMATCAADLRLFCNVVLESSPWLQEPTLIPLPWSAPVANVITRPLRIGLLMNDGVVQPHPPIIRALSSLSAKLSSNGHTIVPFPHTHLQASLHALINKLYFLDNAEEYHETIASASEPTVPILSWLLTKHAPKDPLSIRDTFRLNQLRNKLQLEYAKLWNSLKLDVLLCPTAPSVAPAHGEATYWGYTSVFNILDYAGAVIPVGTVESSDTWEQWPREKKDFMSEEDEEYYGYYGEGEAGPQKYAGAPVAVQLIGRRLAEEALMDVVEEVERCRKIV